MNILYIARHGCGGNDDELAIAAALRMLGHTVTQVQEDFNYTPEADQNQYDFCLFHKWSNVDRMRAIECPKFFWYFDLVEWPDETLEPRNRQRREWMSKIMPEVRLGFCTDGDWVFKHKKSNSDCNLRYLRQGCPYVVSPIPKKNEDIDILFVGIGHQGGQGREKFLANLNLDFPGKVMHVRSGVYREALAKLVSRAKIVVCPDSPVTDRYWSNRMYVLGGVAANFLHPAVPGFLGFRNSYRDREELNYLIGQAISHPREHWEESYDQTLRRDLYLHRCISLIEQINEAL